jgi:hypothetical protein
MAKDNENLPPGTLPSDAAWDQNDEELRRRAKKWNDEFKEA